MSGVYTPSTWDFGQDPERRAPRAKPLPGLHKPRVGVVASEWLESDLRPLGFGKYAKLNPVEVLALDAQYVRWLVKNVPARAGLFSTTLLSQLKAPK